MPPSSKPPTLEEALAKLADAVAKFDAYFASRTTTHDTLSNSLPATTATLMTAITKTEVTTTSPLPSVITPPPVTMTHKLPNIQPENTIMYPTTVSPTYKPIKLIANTFVTVGQVWFSPPNQLVSLPIQCIVITVIKANRNYGLCFHFSGTINSGHRCYPPKFVYLKPKDEPPWDQTEPRCNHVSLEDKARFKAGGIDTCIS